MLLAAHVPVRSAQPSAGEVVEHARRVQERLNAAVECLLLPKAVTDEECTKLAAALRGLAKTLDRHAVYARPAPVPSSHSGMRVYPGQQR
ncbi:hypothetical protein OOZ19_04335 [Saccharopolyspora sp. NFXS83]|uniref:hypothetical protein n=1 Tax=Saccharopolyspora sp. NFXS83 TaxID=2993560 RepID=UPI00224A7C6E|nr:hypothetical protein [Saccharopolyspora sp. NFXS83]MCX2729457.1 hypothetical protein [Saccharopolyspora sp. NFXS83]